MRNFEYKLKEKYELSLDQYGIDKKCYWFDFEHPSHHMPEFKQVFDGYFTTYHWNKWIKPGMTCVDIGAHIGDTAIPMMVSCQATVLAVEPNTYMLPYLEKNCLENQHLGKFVIATEAVTNEFSDNLQFADHKNAMINGGIIDPNWDVGTAARVRGMTGNTITIKGIPFYALIKKYLSAEEIKKIGFVKLDTEGHDIEIIRNMKDFLIKYKPVLFTEWFFAYSDNDSLELFNVISDAGYTAFNPMTMQLADTYTRCEDLLCIHQDNL